MIETEADIERTLAALLALDPALVPIARRAAPLPLRRARPGLAGLCATILAQQVSTASAAAIFRRLEAAVNLAEPAAILAADDETLRLVGLSRPKQRTIRAIAGAVAEGRLDFGRIAGLPAPAAIAEMVAVHGIGTWTAECHLLFACGHEDVFPAGDLALQIAAQNAFARAERPAEKTLRALAERWAPHRATAARLLWADYHVVTRRDAVPLAAVAAQKA